MMWGYCGEARSFANRWERQHEDSRCCWRIFGDEAVFDLQEVAEVRRRLPYCCNSCWRRVMFSDGCRAVHCVVHEL